MRSFHSCCLLVLISLLLWRCYQGPLAQRKQISLNGAWAIAKTDTLTEIPTAFTATTPVPGLIDMAVPALDTNRRYDRGIYWHKTVFAIGEDYPELVQLRLGKVKYHAWVYLNGHLVGEQTYCFTPAVFDIRKFLNPAGEKNELLVGIGTYAQMPDTVMTGHDFEKLTYIPGIYDDVSILLSDYPFIAHVQTAPDMENGQVRIAADIEKAAANQPLAISYRIREVASGKLVAEGKVRPPAESENRKVRLDFTAQWPDVRFWSPEDPFLYELELSTSGDQFRTRFGMRSFTANPNGGPYLLNGKPYYMRGTNVCILRFFEDPSRKGLPWNDQWVTKLHQRFKEMNWNSIRYCIGFPPERWYEIADSLGFLIQDEYPVWTLNKHDQIYPKLTPTHLSNEYRAWLTERWNHPCVVIWDAQNESITPVTGQAIGMVRQMDLSGRPWENGWAAPQAPGDPIEAHPYLFSRYQKKEKPSARGPLTDLLTTARIPHNDANEHDPPQNGGHYPNPLIINEYAWLWLNRDGSTTTLTDRVYDVAFGENLTTEQRFYTYARHLGMLTEYWRAHRLCAGVLHFCGLGYSRPSEPRGQTSDHFIDIEHLEYEPNFAKYVKPAFNPVGLMINFWEKIVQAGENREIEIYAINDLETTWQGGLLLLLRRGEQEISRKEIPLNIGAYGRVIEKIVLPMPPEKGQYELAAEITYQGAPVRSIRKFAIE